MQEFGGIFALGADDAEVGEGGFPFARIEPPELIVDRASRTATLGLRYRQTFSEGAAEINGAISDDDLAAEYGDRVPVVVIDGEEFACWEVDNDDLEAELSN